MAVDLRSVTGDGNNLQHPEWGSTSEQLLRRAAAEYSDGISAPAGVDRPSARAISNALVEQPVENILNDRDLAAMVYVWGQFLDHDLDLTTSGGAAFSVPVPKGDAEFDPLATGTQTIGLTRSVFDPATGTSKANPRQQINLITAFIDGSQVYGSDEARALALRTLSGGQLKTSDGNLMPYDTAGLPNDTGGVPLASTFLAGDVRANENIELTAMHTLFVREHNRLAAQLAARNPTWTDEQLYQQARRLVIGELQAITYNEFLPALLGNDALRAYRGYNPNVNPEITNEFSTAAFRLGHSLLGNDVEFLSNSGVETHEEIGLRDAFFQPALVAETGIDPILKYLASDPAQELDVHIVDEVRNFLFGPPGAGGFDLASLNIQRGRDHGLADYNAVRVAYGLPAVRTFADITSDKDLQKSLEATYGSVDNIDLWVGGLSEDHVRGASIGPTFRRILVDQFERLHDGNRFWYERNLTGRDLRSVQGTSLADVIARNTTTTNLQDNVFFFHNSVAGQVFLDTNGDGRQGRGERGLAGVTLELRDLQGNVIATAVTGRNGSYAFEEVDLGKYQVRLSLPSNLRQTTSNPRTLDMTRGEEMPWLSFGVSQRRNATPATATDSARVAQALASMDAEQNAKLLPGLTRG